MEILGIGPSELIFIVILAIIILGPKDMQKTGKTIGRWLNSIVRSDGYKAFQQTSKEMRNLPTKLMRDANLDLLDTERDIREAMKEKPDVPASGPNRNLPRPHQSENSIQPPQTAVPDVEPNEENP